MTGFTIYINGKDYFFVTTQKVISKQLCLKVMEKANLPGRFNDIRSGLRKANCDIITLPNGRAYYEIYGKNFRGYGSFIDEEKTVIIKL